MSPITTHILDTSRGCPARDVAVTLAIRERDNWRELGRGITNRDGRVADLLPGTHVLEPGEYRLLFATGTYFRHLDKDTFYSMIPIIFTIGETDAHYHVPLLLSPFGYSTYRGS